MGKSGVDIAFMLGMLAFAFSMIIQFIVGYGLFAMAFISEALKLIFIIEIVKRYDKSPVVYGIFCGLGFAIAEIITYVLIGYYKSYDFEFILNFSVMIPLIKHLVTTPISTSALHYKWWSIITLILAIIIHTGVGLAVFQIA